MKLDLVVERLCRLPIDFYGGSKSMVQLVVESQIDANPESLTVPSILVYLTEHPDLIEPWLTWSANKRVSSGWYFSRRSGGFVVGFNPNGEVLNYTRPEPACAEFIVREVKTLIAMLRSP
jgi:hypothetical protein